MNPSVPEKDRAKLPFPLARAVDQACDRFEATWQAGQRPSIEEFLTTVPPEAQEVLLAELIDLDVRYRRRASENPCAEDYVARFPAVDPTWLESVLATKPDSDTLRELAQTPEPGGAGWPVIPGYDLLGVLGEGGMGVVYQARHQALQRRVALKMILPSRPEDIPALLARFRTEAEAQARLQHPNIVQIFEVGEAGGRPYLALEYLEGGGLDKRLAGTPQPPRAAARLVEVLARAMHAAHQCHIVHRDLKPANILLQATPGAEPPSATGASSAPPLDLDCWVPKITDFGVAKFLDADRAQTQTGAVMGTPSYMAPEQARGRSRDIGPATDVYALGAILYELLTGRPPFKGATPLETLEQVVGQEPVSPKRLQPKVHADLVTICLKCLEKEPGHRYASALALAEDLRRFQAGEPILGRRPSPLRQLAAWCRRNPALAAASGLAVAALVAVVTVSILYGLSESRAAGRLRAQQEETEAAWFEARRSSALRAGDQGLLLCQQGDPLRGMSWLARSLQMAPAGTDDLQRSLRANLAGWRRQLYPLRECLEHAAIVRAVAFRPDDGGLIATAGGNVVRLWRARDGQTVGEFKHPAAVVRAVAFRPDSQILATGGTDGIRLWNVATGDSWGEILAPAEEVKAIWAMAFHPTRNLLLTGAVENTAQLWDLDRRKLLRTLRPPTTQRGRVLAVALSPDGRMALTGSADHWARLWWVETGQECGRLRHPSEVWAVAFSPDGQTILTGCEDNLARLWDVAAVTEDKERRLRQVFPHKATVTAVAFHRHGKAILTGSADTNARLWDVTTGEPIGAPVRHGGWVMSVAFSPDDRSILTGSLDRTARLWAVPPDQLLPRFRIYGDRLQTAAISPDHRFILRAIAPTDALPWIGAGSVGLGSPLGQASWLVAATRFSTRAQVQLCDIQGNPLALLPHRQGPVHAAAFSPDGDTLVLGTQKQGARLWNVTRRKPFGEVMLPGKQVLAAVFSPDGRSVVTGGPDGWAQLWDATTGKLLRQLFQTESEIRALAFSPDGGTILAGTYRKAQRWDLKTERFVGKPLTHDQVVLSAAFSPDGRTIVTGSRDFTARLWNAETGELRCNPLPHEGRVFAVAFSPDGRTVVTGSTDGKARLWDAATGMPIGPPCPHPGQVNAVAFSKDGRTILTASLGSTDQPWEACVPVYEDADRLLLWTQVLTGMEVDPTGRVQFLDGPTWRQRRQRLKELGGPPLP